jgi:hypothetical protein
VANQVATSRERSTWIRLAVALGAVLVLAPWVLGIVNNSLGGTSRIIYWGRNYHTSADAPDAALLASGRALSIGEVAIGSTWMPNPLVLADITYAPTVLVVRLPSGRFVSYALSGGP